MNGLQEKPKSWSSAKLNDKDDASWKDFGTSMSAVSFGFAATAILVSMFLITAILERLIKPRTAFFHPRNNVERPLQLQQQEAHNNSLKKLGDSRNVGACYTTDLSVLMPGEQYPTFIAQPAPLPCPREGIIWPSHDTDVYVL